MPQDRRFFESQNKVNPIFNNPTEMEKLNEWAKDKWYIKVDINTTHVTKGRTHKTFKHIKYSTAEELIEDITYYMSCDYCQWRTKR